MKPLAIVFGANSAIAQAMLPYLARSHRVLAVSRGEPQTLPDDAHHYRCDYGEHELAALAETVRNLDGEPVLLFCAVGVLHDTGKGFTPEKKLADLSQLQLTHYFAVNSIVPALILKHFVPLMPRSERARAVMLSAKIAGISDNRLGGWYGYRASKAALNMLVKTAAVELARSHRNLCLVALHPGTTDTPLSKPFTKGLSNDRLFSTELTAQRLWSVIEELRPEDTGRFVHWDGSDLPW